MPRKNPRAKSREITEIQISTDEGLVNRLRYLQKDAEYKASEKGMKEHYIDTLSQEVTASENTACDLIMKTANSMSEDILYLITRELESRKAIQVRVSFADIEEIVNECLAVLKKIKAFSNDEKVFARKSYCKYTVYGQLFNKLIDLDIRFAYFAPKECFKRNDTLKKLNKLPEFLRLSVAQKIAELEKYENADYVEQYMVCDLQPKPRNMLASEALLKEARYAEQKAAEIMSIATKKLSGKIYDFIVKDLGIELGETKNLNHQDLEKTIKFCMPALKKLKSLSYNKKISSKIPDVQNVFKSLFESLIALNIKFAFYAPKDALTSLNIDFSLLSETDKDVMFEKLNRLGLWDSKEYRMVYKDVFDKQIKEMKLKNDTVIV